MRSQISQIVQYAEPINTASAEAFERIVKMFPTPLSAQAVWAFDALREYSLRGGKRLRGSLAAAIYDEMLGSKLQRAGIELGVALEMMQNYLLIIDDVMDHSALRRGEPTIHELHLKEYAPYKVDQHESNMMAVSVGLLAQHMASLVLANLPVSADNVRKTVETVHINIGATGLGQIDDLYQQDGRNIDSNDIVRKYHFKSSYYTFVNPLESGLALAGKLDQQAIKDCEAFGLPAGVAFQLHDDYLGIFGESEQTGKANLDDIQEGKYTLLMQYAFEHASARDISILRRLLGNANANSADLEIVRAILVRSGAAEYIQSEALRYAKEAISAASEAKTWSSKFSELLVALVNFSVERQK